MIKLTICIATYNRAGYIGETLDSIIPQLTEEVELLVVDGASTDNTETIMNNYLKKYDLIRYVRLQAKGGVDQDYDKAVELAKGEMCWLFTDDDLLKAGSINFILDELKNNYSLIIVNSEVRNKDFSKVLTRSLIELRGNKIFLENELDLLFQCTMPYLSFIGGVIINRNLWLQRERTKYYGTDFIHVGVIFQATLPLRALVIGDPLIIIRIGNAQWTSRAFEIWMIKWPKLISSFSNISEKSKKKYIQNPSWIKLRKTIIHRADHNYSFAEYHKWVSTASLPKWWKKLMWLIASMPSPLARIIVYSYGKFLALSSFRKK
ncbi:MAG: glycosyltransferase [Bacteroidales bacterium]